MRNIWIIIKNEVRTVLSKRSYWIMSLLFPAIILLLNVGMQVFIGDQAQAAEAFIPDPSQAPQLGYVDAAGIIERLPPDVSPDLVQPFPDEAAAQAALASGELDRYLFVPSDYATSRQLFIVEEDVTLTSLQNESLFHYIVVYNQVGDAAVAATLINPTAQTETQALAAPSETGTGAAPSPVGNMFASSLPFIMLFIFFFLIVSSSGYMLRSVSREKENRTMEVLLVSLQPRELMVGKVLGLGLVALLQMGIWFGGAAVVFSGALDRFALGGGMELSPNLLVWGVLFFLSGYLLYAALMGVVGALAPGAREAGQFTFVVILPLLIPLWFNAAITANPNGVAATTLSLVPFTAPVTMMTRLVSGAVPLWQVAVALLGVVVTAYLCMLLAARFFRSDTLLSYAPLGWQEFVHKWRAA